MVGRKAEVSLLGRPVPVNPEKPPKSTLMLCRQSKKNKHFHHHGTSWPQLLLLNVHDLGGSLGAETSPPTHPIKNFAPLTPAPSLPKKILCWDFYSLVWYIFLKQTTPRPEH